MVKQKSRNIEADLFGNEDDIKLTRSGVAVVAGDGITGLVSRVEYKAP